MFFLTFYFSRELMKVAAISKPIFPVTLNKVRDLNLLKIRESLLYMKIAIISQLSAKTMDWRRRPKYRVGTAHHHFF